MNVSDLQYSKARDKLDAHGRDTTAYDQNKRFKENGDISLISHTGKLRFRRPVNIYLIKRTWFIHIYTQCCSNNDIPQHTETNRFKTHKAVEVS